jgi:hypothetical protein
VRYLIELGARMGAVGDDGNTAFLASALKGHYETCSICWKKRAPTVTTSTDLERECLGPADRALGRGRRRQSTDGFCGADWPPTGPGAARCPHSRAGGTSIARARARGAEEGTAVDAAPGVPRAAPGPPERALPFAAAPALGLVHGYTELTTTEELWTTGLGRARPH